MNIEIFSHSDEILIVLDQPYKIIALSHETGQSVAKALLQSLSEIEAARQEKAPKREASQEQKSPSVPTPAAGQDIDHS
jgi:hypothetical protein